MKKKTLKKKKAITKKKTPAKKKTAGKKKAAKTIKKTPSKKTAASKSKPKKPHVLGSINDIGNVKPRGLALALKGAHAFFYLLKPERAERLRLWDITEDSIVIDIPDSAPMRKTILGYIPSLTGDSIFEIDGTINPNELPDQMPNTIRVMVTPEKVRKLNRRIYPRHSFTPPASAVVVPEGGGLSTNCRIINLSAGGLRAECPAKLSPDETYSFEFDVEMDGEVNLLKLKGCIVYELPLKHGFSYGVKFKRAKEEESMEGGEASIGSIDRTVDLFSLVNKLILHSSEQ